MTTFEVLSVVLAGIVALVGGIYCAVRMAIRAEVQALEIRIGKEYVEKETCRAIRADCERYHAAAAKTSKIQG